MILASGSPRRRELLGELGLEFTIGQIKDYDETYPASLKYDEIPAYIAEQMRLTVLLSSDERDQVWQQRTERLSLFQEKVGKLRGMMEGTLDSPQT